MTNSSNILICKEEVGGGVQHEQIIKYRGMRTPNVQQITAQEDSSYKRNAGAGHLSAWKKQADCHLKRREPELWSYSHCTWKADEA
ncbi:hypothetical protein GOBAR_DD10114 [Gossypium barbadense]|nr:hypothetical protein GOBAR_DD10114 [Gossypium barbadense]